MSLVPLWTTLFVWNTKGKMWRGEIKKKKKKKKKTIWLDLRENRVGVLLFFPLVSGWRSPILFFHSIVHFVWRGFELPPQTHEPNESFFPSKLFRRLKRKTKGETKRKKENSFSFFLCVCGRERKRKHVKKNTDKIFSTSTTNKNQNQNNKMLEISHTFFFAEKCWHIQGIIS